MNAIKKFILKFSPNLSDVLVGKIIDLGVLTTHKRGEVLVEKGQKPQHFFFIKSGIIRGYFIDKNGKIFAKNIATDIEIAGPLSSLIKNTPSNTIYDCLTDCEIYQFNYQDFLKLSEEYVEVAMFHIKVLNIIFLETERRGVSLSVLSASERYRYFKNRFPNIENLIPQYQIASFLNITNVQLSRIRRKIAGY